MKPNERLRAALLDRGLTPASLAAVLGVDAKTIDRWITTGRSPYRRHRHDLALHLELTEEYLWPEAGATDHTTGVADGEIVRVYPHRWAAPSDLWRTMFDSAREEIGVLVYSGLFLSEDYGVHRILRAKAEQGVRVRILLGDPGSEHVAQRGDDEGVGDAMAAKIKNALVMYAPLRAVEGVEFRLHDTILYNSLYRVDGQLLVNTHIFGFTAAQAPVLHLRRTEGGSMVANYLDSFDRVWDGATPLE
jgi:transcriptional regulator with XRE-family HTH domain